MREILFRGRKKPWGGWAEGSLVKMRDYYRISEKNDMISFGVETETIGQFTGLTDKNGKKIFEGDILDVMHQGVFECRWDEGNFEFGLSNNKESFGIAYVSTNDIFVIGNIHDNPDLLEGGAVLRCCDCVSCKVILDNVGAGHWHCKKRYGLPEVDPTDFCSYGERKDNDG